MYDTLIIGAGAAGLMCAAQGPGRCLLVDHAKSEGEKIRISGGGRCNFTNMYASHENYISQNPHFVKSALSRYTQWDFIDWVSRSGIAYHEKTLGQLFCDNSAKDIIHMLRSSVAKAGGETRLRTKVLDVEKTPNGFDITLEQNEAQTTVSAKNVVIASGGKPIPKMGATDFGLRIARKFALNITNTFAGLVPYTFQGDLLEMSKALAGVALPTTMRSDASFKEAALFTHRGLSGPAALQTSSYWTEGQPVSIQILSEHHIDDIISEGRKSQGKRALKTVFAPHIPSRLLPFLFDDLDVPQRLGDISAKHQEIITERLTNWQMTPSGTEGYRTAEVMVGGVDTDELSSKTMEAKKQPGLYFIGECVDVTGWLGGYNFQWAWSSGWVAAQSIRTTLVR